MTDDELLGSALGELPVAEPRPVDGIRLRARAIRAHRRATLVTGAAAAAVLVAGATVTAANVFEPGTIAPADDDGVDKEPVISCAGDDATRYEAVEPWLTTSVESLAPDQVPDEMRWLWPDDAGPVVRASASDDSALMAEYRSYYADCPSPMGESVVLVSKTDDGKQLWRTVLIERVAPSAVGDRLSGRAVIDTIRVGGTNVSIHMRGQMNPDGNYWSRLTASWSDGSNAWFVTAEPMTYEQLAELVETVSMTNGEIDVSDWPVTAEVDFVHRLDHGRRAYHDTTTFTAEGSARLSVSNTPSSMFLGMPAGSSVTEVDGHTAIVHKNGGIIRWQPYEGVTVELSLLDVNASVAEYVAFAESLQQVPANDPRLVSVWSVE